MPIAFSQTLESRRYDIIRLFMIGMLIAVPFSVLWGYWFCTASITVYETADQFRVSENEVVRKTFPGTGWGEMRTQSVRHRKIFAVFPEKSAAHIARHQQGYFFPKATHNKQARAIPLKVFHVMPTPSGSEEVVLLAESPANKPDPFVEQREGKVCIVVGQAPPIKFLARLSGVLKEKNLPVAFFSQKTTP
jgi:hypothetical protein